MYGEHPPQDDVRDMLHDVVARWRARWAAWMSVSPAEWARPVHWTLATLAWLTGFAMAWSVWWLMGLPARATLEKDLGVEQQTLDRANDAARRLPVLMATLQDAEAESIAWRRLLPRASEIDGGDDAPAPGQSEVPPSDSVNEGDSAWRGDIERLAVRAGLTLEMARSGPSASAGDIEIERAEIRVRGPVANLLGWLAEIDGVPRHVAVERLSLEGPGLGSPGAADASDADAGLAVTVAAYRWQRSVDLSGASATHSLPAPPASPASPALPTLPAPAPRWRMPEDAIDVFRTPLTRHAAQDAVPMTPSGSQASVDGENAVGSMRSGSRQVTLRRTSATGLTATWSEAPPRRRARQGSADAPSVDVMLHGVDAVDALRAFARLTGRSVVIGERVAGRLDMEVLGVSAATAFDVMIRSAGLGVQSLNGVDWIAPRADLLADEQTQLEAAAKREALLPLASRRFTLNYPRALALREIIMGEKDSKGQRLLSSRGSLIADPRTNQLFVTDLPEKLDAMASFIARIDVPVRQVLIEARIVEADDRFSESLGVRLAGYDGRGEGGREKGARPATGSSSGNADTKHGDGTSSGSALDVGLSAAALAGVTPPSLAITLFGRSATRFLQLELSALESTGRGRVVSRPRVVTADKIQAIIEQGTELPYQIRSGRRSVTSVQFRKATLRLEVTPLITPDGQVILDVDVRKDSVGQAVAEGFAVDTRHVKTQVQVENGGTVAIGGIYQEERRDSRASVPWLGDVPLLGALFRNRANDDRRTELLVFLTPSVVPGSRRGEDAAGDPAGVSSPVVDAHTGDRRLIGAHESAPEQAFARGSTPAFLRPATTASAPRAPLDLPPSPAQNDLPSGHPRLTGGAPEATRSARPTHIPVSSGTGTQISAIYAGKRNTCRIDGGGQDHGWTRSGTTSWTAVL
ncbi:type IV pilus secretin PilQ [Pandoraea bronchicola]|uniref:Type IV pilus biogenesis and competence protein PilQ n=1 Tax=Pandoraea bronchicola TaxID=2508287 RepID=A0A5E5BX89_9BURK|nr:type IV pilus secretin PilQ [Pandoraea bronchicola]VVE89936.1 type IV pilus secretin PilQ [Pandoraea bronchicola]